MIYTLPLLYDHSFYSRRLLSTEFYTLSLHDALPILSAGCVFAICGSGLRPSAFTSSVVSTASTPGIARAFAVSMPRDRKSTRLNSSHPSISYAVFCLKKKTYQLYTFIPSTLGSVLVL